MDKKNSRWTCFSVGVLCLAASSTSVAQDEGPRVEWEKTFGGGGWDWGYSVQQTADGGYIVAGIKRSVRPPGWHGYLIKLDAEGDLDSAWSENPRTFARGDCTVFKSVQQTADGGYIVAGYTASSCSRGVYDVYLIKLDGQGHHDPAWPENPRIFGGVEDGKGNSVQQTADGGYIVAGLPGLIKLDAQGFLDPAWPQNPKTLGGLEGRSVQQTADGGYIVAGSTGLIKLDKKGFLDPAWPENPMTFAILSARSVQQTADGGYIMAGLVRSVGRDNFDVYLTKLDTEGGLDPAWPENPRTFGGAEKDGGTSVQQTDDGGYIVAGWTNSFGAGDFDVYLVKLDAAGFLDPAWSVNPRTFGEEEDDLAESVQQTADGGYIVAGSTKPFGAGRPDVYLIKFAPAPPAPPVAFRRGDANADGHVNLVDAVATLNVLFAGVGFFACNDAADADDSGAINVTDAVLLLNHLFGPGPAPSVPFANCGLDPTDDKLDCADFAPCP